MQCVSCIEQRKSHSHFQNCHVGIVEIKRFKESGSRLASSDTTFMKIGYIKGWETDMNMNIL